MHYAYTPHIWPSLLSAGFLAVLAGCVWHRRSVPGALPLAILLWLTVPWVLGHSLGLAAADIPTMIFWAKYRYAWLLPMATAGLCFTLEYAHPGIRLTPRILAPLIVPPLAVFLLVLTNDSNHLLWRGFTYNGRLHPHYGPADQLVFFYGLLLLFSMSAIFVWLFVRSPLHRKPVLLCLCGQFIMRLSLILAHLDPNPISAVDLLVFGVALTGLMYALALFRFHMFELLPVARKTVLDQMSEGMLVLDARRRVVDLNPSAERILGVRAIRARGALWDEVIPEHPMTESEIIFNVGGALRYFALRPSPLLGPRGMELGSIILLHDVTEQRRSQARLFEQQSASATLRERDRVARELHDSLGQILAFVKVQTLAAREFLGRGREQEADECLARLAAVAQEAHADVREYISGARAGKSADHGFFPALQDYLQRFRQSCALAVKLNVSSELNDAAFRPMVGAQLLRIIQEALTNVRKHSGATEVDIRITTRDEDYAEAIIEDDGTGFDPSLLELAGTQNFGLRFMRERAEEIGGTIRVQSANGAGSRVVISVPLRKELQ